MPFWLLGFRPMPLSTLENTFLMVAFFFCVLKCLKDATTLKKAAFL